MCKIREENIGDVVDIEYSGGIELNAEIVTVACPACGEEFIGTKRNAGGFIAGHEAYHRHENDLDMMVQVLGGA